MREKRLNQSITKAPRTAPKPKLFKRRDPEYVRRFEIAAKTAKWAVTMTQVRIRQAIADNPWPHWHPLSFTGRDGRESRGVVDLIAVRKDHGEPPRGTRRGDALQIILIQVKGGSAANPTAEDAARLHIIRRRHGACCILLATWKKGSAAQFFSLNTNSKSDSKWRDVEDLRSVFA
jgi:hypothetical protein